MKRKFAVFDIDGTISRDALFFQIVNKLVEKNILSEAYENEIKQRYELYKKRTSKQAFKTYAQYSVNILLENLDKISVKEYRDVVDEVIPKNAEYTYVYTTNLINKLKSQGFFLIALSGSEMYSVQKFTEKLGFDIAFGEHYHEKNGIFTGEIDQVVGKKDAFIKKFVIDHNLTMKNSWGIGDSSGDIEMLRLVDNPIAFNPEEILYEEAKKNNWKIVVERKNVIFELEPNNGSFILA